MLDTVIEELSKIRDREKELEQNRDSIIYLMNMLGIQQQDIAKRAKMGPANVRKILAKEEARNPDSASVRHILEQAAEELRGRI